MAERRQGSAGAGRTAACRSSAARCVLIALIAGVVGVASPRGKESTDDAQVEGHITQIAARVGGTVVKVHVTDNQHVEGRRPSLVADRSARLPGRGRSRAAPSSPTREATAAAAGTGVPIAAVSTRAPACSTATGGVEEAQAGVARRRQPGRSRAQAQLVAAQARQRETRGDGDEDGASDVERLKPLVAKDEISQQQFDAAVAAADAARAAADAAKSEVAAAETAIAVAEQRAVQARGAASQAQATLADDADRARSSSRSRSARAAGGRGPRQAEQAALAQAELNLRTHDDQGADRPASSAARPSRSARSCSPASR